MEKIYWHKPFSRHYNKPVDHFLFLLAVYLTGRVWLPFPCYDRKFDIETDVFAYIAVCG